MSTELTLIFLSISFVGLLLFWLFYRQSNSTGKLSERYLIQQLKDQKLSDEQRSINEKLLSNILQQQGNKKASFKLLAIVTIFVVPFSLFFYNKLGNPAAIDYVPSSNQQSTAQSAQQITQGQAPQLSMQDAIKQLEERLTKDPDNVDGQMLYARSLISLKDYAKAVTAYRKSNELAPNEPVILTELAEAIALANNNRSFLGEPEGLLTKAVELDPNNQKALWLLGMTFYEHKDYKKTNELWSKLYTMMSDEGAKKQLAQQLNDIRSKLGLETISEIQKSQEPQKVIANKSNLKIKIKLSKKLKENLKGKRALLYVYTKEAQGMPMPIAVIRQPLEQIVKGFPIDLSMNDGNSLQPTRKLSDFDSIKIGARISFTGNAMPQAGDLQSDEILIDLPTSETVELVIDKVR
jgi:cytochrome c-type biogenesis protein CcmH